MKARFLFQSTTAGACSAVKFARISLLSCTVMIFLISNLSNAQNFATAHPSICLLGNTGVDWDPQANYVTPRPIGWTESNWQVDIGGGYGTPVIIAPPAQPVNHCLSWSPGNTNPPNNWITHPSLNCNGVKGEYSCINPWPGGGSFRYRFWLPANTNLHINWLIWASDWVQNIYVNSELAYDSKISGLGFMFHRQNALSFSWCRFRAGQWNDIIIYVRTVPQAQVPQCKTFGLKVDAAGCGMTSSILGPTLVCEGSTNCYVLSPTVNAASTYTWSKPGGWANNSTSATLCTKAGPVSGVVSGMQYSPVWTGGNMTFTYYCLTAGAMNVSVIPMPTITTTGTLVCSGKQATLTATQGMTTYSWYANGTGNGSPIAVNQHSIAVTPPGTGNWVYLVKGVGPNGCQFSKTVTLTVIPSPPTGINASTNNICSGQCVTLWGTGAATYTWQTNPTTTNNPIIVCPPVTSPYTVIGRATNGCTNAAVVTITVRPSPTIAVQSSNSVVCSGNCATLTASGASTYTWVPWNIVSNTLNVCPSASTVYTVSATATNSCVSQGTATVLVLQSPTVTVNPPFICTGIPNTLTAVGANTYTWYIGGTTPATISNTNPIVLNLTSPTPYTVCGTAQNSCTACYMGTINLGLPVPITAPDVTLCTNAGPCATVTASSTMTPASFTWNPGGIPGATVVVCPTVSTVYNITATSSAGCPNSATMAVIVTSVCCAQPTAGLTRVTSLSGTQPSGVSWLLDGSISLSGNTTMQNGEYWITPGVKITVPSGTVLTLNNVHLFACGLLMWDGIEVLDGGRIVTPQIPNSSITSLIEDAETAIDLSNMSGLFPGPALDIGEVIFNRNYIGIKISNSAPPVTSIPLGINGCVFISHNVPFGSHPNPLSWPSAHVTGGLRAVVNPTSGLQAPYLNLGQPMTLKAPHTNQPGHVGIRIENIGFPLAFASSPGVEWGITYPGINITNDFNLFDGLYRGVDVKDANLTTINNVFQNMQMDASNQYGEGIHHEITTIMNARLSLNGQGGIDLGNRFWDCYSGVSATNVYELTATNCIFRSTHTQSLSSLAFVSPGATGIRYESNRFNFNVAKSEFNNLLFGIYFTTPATGQPYDMTGNGASTGVFADRLLIDQNYFGPHVLSSTPIPNEYMYYAMVLWGPPVNGWVNGNNPSSVVSNRLDRVFRGMYINGLEDHPLSVVGNSVYVIDDYVFGQPNFGTGIWLKNSMDAKTIASNTLHGQSSGPPSDVSLIFCEDNYCNFPSNQKSPKVTCNFTHDSHYGFHFDGWNGDSEWGGNTMCNHFAGLALTNNGVIGQQGSPAMASDNFWEYVAPCNPWGSIFAPNETYCENSDPNLSPLWVWQSAFVPPPPPVGGFWPQNNLAAGVPGIPYMFPANINTTSTHNLAYMDCASQSMYPAVPSWRTSSLTTTISQPRDGENISIFPSPTDGKLTVNILSAVESVQINVMDLTGKVVLRKIYATTTSIEVDISHLAAGVYIVEVNGQNSTTWRRKIMKTP